MAAVLEENHFALRASKTPQLVGSDERGARARQLVGREEQPASVLPVSPIDGGPGGDVAPLHGLAALGAGFGRVEDTGVAGWTTSHEQDATFGAELGPGRHRKAATRAGETELQPAGRTGLIVRQVSAVVYEPGLLIKGMTTARAENLPTGRADAIVVIDAGCAGRTAQGVRPLFDRIGPE